MIVAFDNTFLTLLLNPKAKPRPNPSTGVPVTHCRMRVEALVDRLSEKGAQLIVPTPALGEALEATDRPDLYTQKLQSYACIETSSFDERAMVELSIMNRSARQSGDKKSGVDAEMAGLKVVHTWELDLPAKYAQMDMLEPKEGKNG